MMKLKFLGFGYSDMDVTEASVDLYTESKNLRIFRNTTGASRWEWTIRFSGGYWQEMWNVFMAHYVANKNVAFDLDVPQHWLNVSNNSEVVVSSPANSNSENISVASTDSIDIPVGRFVRIAGSDKVYIVTEYSSADDNSGVMKVSPRITKPVGIGATVILNGVTAKVKHAPTNVGFSTRGGVRQDIRWRFIEAL